ncbi:MAG: hypothetical protein IPK30_09220 [Cellvibrionales bacterium]|nr:hypothetical protein [Cellvibrionales bacterium]
MLSCIPVHIHNHNTISRIAAAPAAMLAAYQRTKPFYKSAFDMNVKLELNGKPRCAGNSVAFSFDVVMTGMKISPIDVFELNADGKVQSMKAYWSADNMS